MEENISNYVRKLGVKPKFSILLFLLMFASGYAQNLTVSGEVVDAEGLPLPGVNVFIVGTSQGTTTNFDGNYTLENVP